MTGGAGSGIIKESSSKPITGITDKAINKIPLVQISGYSEQQCSTIRNAHRELLEYAPSREAAFVFDSDLSNRREYLGSDDVLSFGNNTLRGNNLFVMHNHPRNSSYSTTDLHFFCDTDNVKTLTIVKNNGDIEYITKGESYDAQMFMIEYNRLYKKIVKSGTESEVNRFVKTFLNKTKSGVIWSERE